MTEHLDFGSLETKSEEEKGAGSEKKALPALDSGGSGGGIGQTRHPGLNIPPVVAGCGTKGPKFRLVPQLGAVAAPEGRERPAFGSWPPTGRRGRTMA